MRCEPLRPLSTMGWDNSRPCAIAIWRTFSDRCTDQTDCSAVNPASESLLSHPVGLGMTSPGSPTGAIAGSVLPIRRAEELIATLQGVLSVRIVPSDSGAIDEIHVLTTDAVLPKQTVRNIESALMAQLGLRVNHRKISIATTLDTPRATDAMPPASLSGSHTAYVPAPGSSSYGASAGAPAATEHRQRRVPPRSGNWRGCRCCIRRDCGAATQAMEAATATSPVAGRRAVPVDVPNAGRRALIFEDVEVRRSRSQGRRCAGLRLAALATTSSARPKGRRRSGHASISLRVQRCWRSSKQ